MNPIGRKNLSYAKWWVHAAGLGACLVISIASYALGVAPLIQRSADMQDAIEEQQHQEQEKAKLARSYNQLKQKLETTQQELNEAAFQLQPVNRLNGYMAQLTNLATQCGLSLHEIKPSDPIALQHYRAIPIRLSGAGTYQDTVIFLHRLNQEFLDIRLSGLGLRASGDPAKNQGKINMKLVWYTAPAN